jgi:hypothetical protein
MEVQQQVSRVEGPVDYLILRFPGNKFTGKIAPELRRLQEEGIIRIMDFLFISKDGAGNVESFEISDLGTDAMKDFESLVGKVGGWFSQNDVEMIGADLPSNSSVGAILYENTWAVRATRAFREAGAEVLEQGRIRADQVDLVFNERVAPGARG